MDEIEDLHSVLHMWPAVIEKFSFHIEQILSSPRFLIYVYMCMNIYVSAHACVLHICRHTYIYKIKAYRLKRTLTAVTHKPDLPGFQKDLTLFLNVQLL